MEALAVSSPSLHPAMETLRGDAPMKPNALRTLVLSATRYLLPVGTQRCPRTGLRETRTP